MTNDDGGRGLAEEVKAARNDPERDWQELAQALADRVLMATEPAPEPAPLPLAKITGEGDAWEIACPACGNRLQEVGNCQSIRYVSDEMELVDGTLVMSVYDYTTTDDSHEGYECGTCLQGVRLPEGDELPEGIESIEPEYG